MVAKKFLKDNFFLCSTNKKAPNRRGLGQNSNLKMIKA